MKAFERTVDKSPQPEHGRSVETNAFTEFQTDETEQFIPTRFEQRVANCPDRIAVKSKLYRLSYSQLNSFANRIGRAILASRGEGQESVALLLGDDAPKIAAIFGTLKAGKFYVPMDPTFPASTLASILEDCRASAVVTDNVNLPLVRGLIKRDIQVVNIDELNSNLGGEDLGLPISPDHLAYILYTSGSTGKPKGIFQNHRNVLCKVRNYTNTSRLISDDRLSLIVSLGFSAAVPNIFAALLNGASLFPFNVKEEGLANLAKWLRDEEITIYQSAVTLFRYLADSLSENEFPRLRLIDLFGEAVSIADIERCRKHFSPACVLRNRLASTETGDVCQYMIHSDTPVSGDVVPVGYPVEGVKVSLLDDEGREVEFNVAGEIAVKSRHLALGYWQDPELTAARFLPDPEGTEERIYLTGDLGRMLPDGCLVHLGRKDTRLKIRGHRVEVAEVEMALLEHAAIKEAAVVAQDDLRDEKRLVAYVVPKSNGAVKTSELRAFVQSKLPDYMVPSVFVQLDALPINANGKVDRQALPMPEQARPELGEVFLAPQSKLERIIAGIWKEVLRSDKVGVHDSFFDLGGNSLLLMEAHAKLSKIFGDDLSVTELFEYPTVSSLAGYLGQEENQKEVEREQDRVDKLKTGQARLKKQSGARREKA